MAVVEHHFRVMASEAHVIVVDPAPGAIKNAERRLHQLEQRWSRFLGGSDISRINMSQEEWVPVSSDTLVLIETMQAASVETDGRFDPTLMHELLVAGYTASIEDPARVSVTIDISCMGLSVHDVILDGPRSQVWVPPGLALDPGGLGKGLAADLVVNELLADGSAGALVSIGGDLFAAGRPPTPTGWQIVVEDPLEVDHDLLTIEFDGGGVATSSTVSRRWQHDGSTRHHLIDPTSRDCSTTDLAGVTVVAATGWQAEAHATGAILVGSDGVIDYLRSNGLTGVGTTLDGSHFASDNLNARPTLEAS